MQFEFLVTTERKYFLCKNGNPPTMKKVTAIFPSTPPSENWFPVKPLPFWEFSRRLKPPRQKWAEGGEGGEGGGGGAYYVNVFWLVLECCSIMHKAWWLEKHWHTWKNWCKDFQRKPSLKVRLKLWKRVKESYNITPI